MFGAELGRGWRRGAFGRRRANFRCGFWGLYCWRWCLFAGRLDGRKLRRSWHLFTITVVHFGATFSLRYWARNAVWCWWEANLLGTDNFTVEAAAIFAGIRWWNFVPELEGLTLVTTARFRLWFFLGRRFFFAANGVFLRRRYRWLRWRCC